MIYGELVYFDIYRIEYDNPSRGRITGGLMVQIVEARAESQWIVGQAYSRTYNTRSQSSRLQAICPDNKYEIAIRTAALRLLRRRVGHAFLNLALRLFLFIYYRSKRCFPARILT